MASDAAIPPPPLGDLRPDADKPAGDSAFVTSSPSSASIVNFPYFCTIRQSLLTASEFSRVPIDTVCSKIARSLCLGCGLTMMMVAAQWVEVGAKRQVHGMGS